MAASSTIEETLRRTSFGTVSPAVLKRFADHCVQKRFSANEVLWHEGDSPSGWAYILVDGEVRYSKRGITIGSYGPGHIGGLTSVIAVEAAAASEPRSATHTAVKDSVAIRIERDFFASQLREPEFALAIMNYMNQRERHKTDKLAAIGGEPVNPSLYRICVFDTKSHDSAYLSSAFPSSRYDLKFVASKLSKTTAPLAAGCAAVCIFVNDTCDAEALHILKTLGVELILLRCAGFNNVDLPVAGQLGFSICRVPAYSPYAVAEHAFALLMTVNRNTHRAFNRVRDGNFSIHGLVGFDLHGKNVGVVGTGKIGKLFANICKGAGMNIYCHDAYEDKAWAKSIGAKYVSADEIWALSDVISVHVPLFPSTFHLINDAAIAKMRKGVIIVNTSRGAIVDASALLKGLLSGKIGGAGLDVYEEEKAYFFEDRSDAAIQDELLARLINLPNVVLTSHQAFFTKEALSAIAATTFQNAEEFFVKNLRHNKLTNHVEIPSKL